MALAGGFPYDGPATSPAGETTFQLPGDMEVDAVMGWKPAVGLDYIAARSTDNPARDNQPPLATDNPIELKLSRSPVVSFRFIDDAGAVLKGERHSPWILTKPGQSASLNLTTLHGRITQRSDAEGVIAYDWLPGWQERKVSFNRASLDMQRINDDVDVTHAEGEVQDVTVPRLTPIEGKVLDADGRPASGVYVLARGAGVGGKVYSRHTLTGDDGTYRLEVAPDQIDFLVAISDDGQSVSAQQDGLLVYPEQPLTGVSMQLRPATRISGRAPLIDKPRRYPILRQVSEDLNARTDATFAVAGAGNEPVRATDEFLLEPDAKGDFSVFAGPGRYEFVASEDAPVVNFEISDETEYRIPERPN